MDILKTLLIYMSVTLAGAVQATSAPEVTPVPTPAPTPTAVVETVTAAPSETAEAAITEAITATPTPTVSVTPEPVPTITPNRAYHNLAQGAKGTEVRKLQERLIELGYLPEGSADGAYGNQTRNAVRKFQYYNGLTQDGVAGRTTQTNLFENPDAAPYPSETPNPPAEETAESPEKGTETPETVTETPVPIIETPAPEAEETPEPEAPVTPESKGTETPEVTEEPAPEVTGTPEPEATEEPTPEVTEALKPEPTETPEPKATETPEQEVTEAPTPEPTETPEPEATEEPKPEVTETPEPKETETPEPEETEAPTPEATETPKTEATDTPEPEEAETPEIIEDVDLDAGPFELIDGSVVVGDSGSEMEWVELEDGVPVARRPRLEERNGRIRVSLEDLIRGLETWRLTRAGDTLVLEAAGYVVGLYNEESGPAATVDGLEVAMDPEDFDFDGDGAFIDASFLARCLGGDAEWDAEEKTLMLRIPGKEVSKASD